MRVFKTANQIRANQELVPILKRSSAKSADCEVKIDYEDLEDRRSLKSFYDKFVYRDITTF